MLINFIKKILITIFLFSSVYIFGQDDSHTKRISKRKYYDQGYGINKNSLMQAYNAPARVNVYNRYDFFIEGNFIWWQPKEKGLTIGTAISSDLQNEPTKILNFNPNYKAGFKAGIGMHHNLDDWTLFAQYLWFNRDNKNTHTQTENFYCEWLETSINEVQARWDLRLNLIELELSRTSLTGKNLIFSPNFTLSGGWLDQKYIISNPSYFSKAASNSWLIGPKVGIKTSWNKSNFKITANASTSLYYQNYSKILYELKNLVSSSFTEKLQMNTYYLTPNLNLDAGAGFNTYFSNRRFHIDLLVKYEFLHFWNQNQMRFLLNEIRFTRFDAGNLMLHGITASLRLDY